MARAMAEDWSQQEVEIIVEDYLGMLGLELRRQDYNKAERNRALQKLLPARSRGSIEFKHANISAVMIEMGYPYVDVRRAEYHVYRLFDFSKSPRLFVLGGSMRSTCRLEAVQFRVTPGSSDE